jgi:diguanylate cyclase (GGDEF)-like protein/PAS domain S-box-containing protein
VSEQSTSNAAAELARHKLALSATGDAIFDWDLNTGRIVWSEAICSILGIHSTGAVDTAATYLDLVAVQDEARRAQALARQLGAGETQPFDCEYRLRRPDGQSQWVRERALAVRDASGRPARLVGVLVKLEARSQREARLEWLSRYDELTGHLNRARLREAVEHAIEYSRRYDRPSAYLLVAIDNLGLLNNAYGYDVADAVIVQVGQRLEQTLRASDVIGRVAGNQFGVLLSQCGETEMAIAADKLLAAVRQNLLDTPRGPISVTVSIGGVLLPINAMSAHEAMGRASEAVVAAKRSGRDCFIAYQPARGVAQMQDNMMALGERVVAALRADRLCLAFQPVVRAADGGAMIHEALLRLMEPSGVVVPAGIFMPSVEALGVICRVDRRVLELLTREFDADADVHLAVNVSGLTVTDASWLRGLRAAVLANAGLAKRLVVEITETAAMRDLDESVRFVAALKEMGVRVALDDFGAGSTSFRHLKALGVDLVKIDGSFVRGLAANPDNQLFIRALVDLATGFGAQVVAECVETAEDAAAVKRFGVDFLQGWHFGRPQIERCWASARPALRAVAS